MFLSGKIAICLPKNTESTEPESFYYILLVCSESELYIWSIWWKRIFFWMSELYIWSIWCVGCLFWCWFILVLILIICFDLDLIIFVLMFGMFVCKKVKLGKIQISSQSNFAERFLDKQKTTSEMYVETVTFNFKMHFHQTKRYQICT